MLPCSAHGMGVDHVAHRNRHSSDPGWLSRNRTGNHGLGHGTAHPRDRALLLLLHTPGLPLPADLRAAIAEPHQLLPSAARLRSLRDQLELPLRLRQSRIDLYHATYYAMALNPGLPYVVNVFDLIPERYPQYWSQVQSPIIRRWLRQASTRAQRIFAPSARHGHRPGIAIPDPCGAHCRGAARRRSRLAAVAAGTYSRPGGTVLPAVCLHQQAAQKPVAPGRGVRAGPDPACALPDLVIAGGWDPRYPEARHCAARLDVDAEGAVNRQGVVRFRQDLDDTNLQELYRRALGFIFPSEYEGFGLPILEAMNAGLPVAASRTPAVAEVAGDACLPFDPRDSGSIAEAIVRLSSDTDHQRTSWCPMSANSSPR